MNFKIHRGTNEIGGICIEISTVKTRILVDFGMPLVDKLGDEFDIRKFDHLGTDELIENQILPDVEGLYDASNIDGILISHYHQDHYGLLSYADSKIPIYTGKATQKVIEFNNQFFNGEITTQKFINFEHSKQFKIRDIKITPYLVDHSAFDAYAFLIDANGKRLFYSGDYRAHGRKKSLVDFLFKHPPLHIDYLLLEGTTIARNQNHIPTETELEDQFLKLFGEKEGLNLINVSSQNIDRLVTIYRACKRTNKIMVLDVYTALILKMLSRFSNIPYPSNRYSDMKVIFPQRLSRLIVSRFDEKHLFQFKKYKLERDKIISNQEKFVILVRPSMKRYLEKFKGLKAGNFIYSMWSGYLKQDDLKEFVHYLDDKGFKLTIVHTSGHADLKALKQLVEAIKPNYLVPIHTFEADSYRELFDSVEVKRIEDGEMICL